MRSICLYYVYLLFHAPTIRMYALFVYLRVPMYPSSLRKRTHTCVYPMRSGSEVQLPTWPAKRCQREEMSKETRTWVEGALREKQAQ